jgi:periplasmic protein TonB
MSLRPSAPADVFSVREIARAAGVSVRAARELSRSVELTDEYLPASRAIRLVRQLRRGMIGHARRDLFSPPPAAERAPRAGVIGSSVFHAGVVGMIVLITSLGLQSDERVTQRLETTRLVYLATPGPGGGGGGGGLKMPKPPARAEMKGAAPLKSPVPPPRPLTTRRPEPQVRRPDPPPVVAPRPAPVDPPPPAPRPEVTPQVVAPVATASSDPQDRAGLPTEKPSETESQGSGSGGGAGSGQGSGVGEGTGAGIGPGSGGGTGGGPYRPGSGITPPAIVREVRPEYTEDARRMGIEGDVVLEIIVRHDGTVGEVKVLRGLAGGLDRRAIEAVRQWRFSPARRYGTPVDVVVEVAVEFKLR